MNSALKLPGGRYHEYLLLIDPHEDMRQKIENCRANLTEKYGLQQPFTGRPHVSLVCFKAEERMEEKLLPRLQRIAMEEKPFVVELRDYGSYPMHAIFIRIANQPRVLQLITRLKQLRTLMKAGGEDPYFLQDPQIALAGRIPKRDYIEAMKEYQHKKFSGRFMAAAFLLLKRKENEKNYQLLQRFEFKCLPLSTEQSVLF